MNSDGQWMGVKNATTSNMLGLVARPSSTPGLRPIMIYVMPASTFIAISAANGGNIRNPNLVSTHRTEYRPTFRSQPERDTVGIRLSVVTVPIVGPSASGVGRNAILYRQHVRLNLN
jgi:hypothetical protein